MTLVRAWYADALVGDPAKDAGVLRAAGAWLSRIASECPSARDSLVSIEPAASPRLIASVRIELIVEERELEAADRKSRQEVAG